MDKSFQSTVSMGGRHHIFERPGSDIKRTGYLRKLKTMKKKFFVLRCTSSSGPARLEYYDSEKKFRSGNLPKRSIQLHTCFNINKKTDSRAGKFGIVLYTVQDSFTILTESEAEQESWLDGMLEYQNEYLPEGDKGKEHYEHVWQLTMQARGLGQGKGLKGRYRMCLNSTTISLFKVNANQPQFSIQLVTIRAVGHNDNSFWLELGNYSSTGPGEFWFLVEDAAVAKDMHTTIVQYMASVKDYLDKDQQFSYSKKPIHSGFLDSFGGLYQQYGDSRKTYSFGAHPNDASLDFVDYSVNKSDGLTDSTHPLYSGDFDGELSSCFDNSLPDHPSMLGHHSLGSSHTVGKHTYNFSELLYPTQLPTVKEGGSAEGYLLSELPSSETSSTDFSRPEPAPWMLADETEDLPPRTYSLGSRPTKKFHGFPETGSRKVAGNEISRATSAPHIPKGRRERERTIDSPTPAASLLSMSMKSDDSDSVIEYGPIRPRTASDSFNYRSRTSSFGKSQQNCRPRSSSYGQGKRPTINISKLKLERAMMSGNVSQRTSRESSLQSSFESLRVSSESLRRPSLELRQPRGIFSTEQCDHRNTPSPQMKQADSDSYVISGPGFQKAAHFMRTESSASGRPSDNITRRSDHPRGSCSEDVYVNVDFGAQPTTNDNKPMPAAARSQPSRVEASRHTNVDLSIRNRKSHGGRSLSVENVDTYFICELPFTTNAPRTGSVGSKDKQQLRPDTGKKSMPIPVPSSVPSSSASQQSVPYSSMSSHSFGGSDSMRRPPPCLPSNEKHVMPDFRQKSGSTGTRPNTTRTSFGMTSGRGHCLPGDVPMRKSSLPRFPDDESAGEYIEFPFLDSRRDTTSSRPGSSDMTKSGNIQSTGVTQSEITQSGKESSITQSDITQSGTSNLCPRSLQSGQNDQTTSSEGGAPVHSNPAKAPSPSSSPCKVASHPTTSSTKDLESYVFYNPVLPTPLPHQEPSHFHRHDIQKLHQTAELAFIPQQTDSTKHEQEYVNFQPRTAQSTKHEFVDHESAKCKPSSASSTVPSPFRGTMPSKDSDGYVEYKPGSVSCESLKHLTPDSAFSNVPTYKDSRTTGLTKPKQCQKSISIPTKVRTSVSQKAVTNTDCRHGPYTSGCPHDMDPEPLLPSMETCPRYFQPIKTQSLDKVDITEHKDMSSSADVNALPPTGLTHKHVRGCDNDSSSSSDCIATFSKENSPSSYLSCSSASGENKCENTCSEHKSGSAAETGSNCSSEHFDSLTHGSACSLLKSMKPTVTSRTARPTRHSLGDIMSVSGTKDRASKNRSPPSTCNTSARDDLQMNLKTGICRSLTECDFCEVTPKVTSQNLV
ncbi:hypothetical protein BsWGS_23986 [Bradybaena similaris]